LDQVSTNLTLISIDPDTIFNGNTTQNVLPSPGVLLTPIEPPTRIVSSLLMARPRPVPP
jgi:hypothetical protein